MSHKLLVVNIGSTSTKIAVYENDTLVWKENLNHPRENLAQYLHYMDQYDYRKQAILDELARHREQLSGFDAFVSRGGTIRPIPGGTWRISKEMLEDSQSGRYGDHPCNIGGQIAYDLAQEFGCEALTVDPPICGELCVEATYSGLAGIERAARFQQLNHRAMARKYAEDTGVPYESLNLIVAHMGGGISVAAHHKGRIIDVNNALAGDGPFALERSGGLPVGDLIELCYSGRYSMHELLRRVNGRGGVYDYLGFADGRKLEELVESGDEKVAEVVRAMAYQIAKEIGALSAVLSGRVDAIILTAGLAYWNYFTRLIEERVSFLAPVHRYPGENEMEALAKGALRFLQGQEPARDYDCLFDDLGRDSIA